jgi:hypothetical protein
MANLCKYKNMFGEPGTGAHSYRFFNIAVVDVVLTILAAFLLSWMTKISFFYCVIAFFILGIIALVFFLRARLMVETGGVGS